MYIEFQVPVKLFVLFPQIFFGCASLKNYEKKQGKFSQIPMILNTGLLLLQVYRLAIAYANELLFTTLSEKNPYLYYVLIFHGNLDLFYYNIHAFLSSISLNIGN